ncbi:MAG: hypothetical protein JNL74_22405, partial [Fibrobacteres bacterium]|nr:hypothetical protein [Fibrobacterota bacterium]
MSDKSPLLSQEGAGAGLPVLLAVILFALKTDAEGATKYWSGATNKLFTTAGNWVGGVAPIAGDSIVFDNQGTNKPCSVGANTVALASVKFQNDYTGYFTFRAVTGYIMSVTGDCDLRSGGDIIPNAGQISFTGSTASMFYAHDNDTMPRVVVNATAGTAPWLSLSGKWNTTGLSVTNGNVRFDNTVDTFAITGTITSASTADTVDFTGSTIILSGNSQNLRYGTYLRSELGGRMVFNFPGLVSFAPNNVNVTSAYSDIIVTNSCSLRVNAYPLRSSGRVLVDNGSINIDAVTCSLGTVKCVNGGNFIMTGAANVCILGDTLDLNSFTSFSQTAGTLRFFGSNPKTFIPFPGVTLPQLIVLGTGTVSVRTNPVTTGIVTLTTGSLASYVDMKISGSLTATNPLVMYSDTLDLSSAGTISTTGTITFSKSTGEQIFIPKAATNLPAVKHDGGATLKVLNNPISAYSFLQTAGELDLNGMSLSTTTGSLRIVNAISTAIKNFDGLTLSAPAGQFIQLSGTPSTKLNLQAATGLTLNGGGVTRGRVVVEYADISNVTVIGNNGLALNSASISGNSGFEIMPGRIWDGEGAGGNWGDPLNWSNDALPSDSESVFFGLYSLKSCTLDIDAEIKGLNSLTGYSQRFNFGTDTIKVGGTADFRSFSAVDAGSGALEFTNSDSANFYPIAFTFPSIILNGSGVTTVKGLAVSGNELILKKGIFVQGHVFTNVFKNIKAFAGSSLDMDSASYLRCTGDTVDLRDIDTVIFSHPNTSILQFRGSAPNRQVYLPSPTQWFYQIHQ